MGYVVFPADLVPAFGRVRQASDISHATLEQAVLADFIREGHLARHIRRMRMLYMERNDALVTEINKQLGTIVEIVSAHAAMHLVGLLPLRVEDTTASSRATRATIASSPLSISYRDK